MKRQKSPNQKMILSFLNYEPPIKIVKVNVSSTTKDSTPIASPLRKRVVDKIVRSKVYICKLKSKLLAAETKVKQLQRALKTQKTKNSRLRNRSGQNLPILAIFLKKKIFLIWIRQC